MRTTLNLDEDVLEAARSLAEAKHIPLGAAVSILVRRGLKRLGLRLSDAGVLVFDTPPDFPRVTSEDMARLLADFP